MSTSSINAVKDHISKRLFDRYTNRFNLELNRGARPRYVAEICKRKLNIKVDAQIVVLNTTVK
jgi:hypothetical protein